MLWINRAASDLTGVSRLPNIPSSMVEASNTDTPALTGPLRLTTLPPERLGLDFGSCRAFFFGLCRRTPRFKRVAPFAAHAVHEKTHAPSHAIFLPDHGMVRIDGRSRTIGNTRGFLLYLRTILCILSKKMNHGIHTRFTGFISPPRRSSPSPTRSSAPTASPAE